MKKTKLLLLVISVLIAIPKIIRAQALGYNNNRIACSADGNNQPDLEYTGTYDTADPDDWGAFPAALIMLAKRQLQDKLVHFSYNNFMPSPPHTTEKNYMKDAADQGIERLKFNGDVFFDVGTHKSEAIMSLKDELIKSTASDPLYFIHMGPSEFFYQAVKATIDAGGIEALAHVYVISHSNYNDNHLRRDTEHTMEQTIALSGDRLKYNLIQDQNNCNVAYLLWCSGTNPYQWRNIEAHSDPHIQWLWQRMLDHKHGKYDISDAGMVYYLLTNDQNGSPAKFEKFLDYGILLPGDELTESVNIEDAYAFIYPQRAYQLKYSTFPAEPWDDFMTWTTSDASVVYVSPSGRLVGVSEGTASITVNAGLGEFTDEIEVVVSDIEDCSECSSTCELIEKDGLLVIEAERFNLKGAWSIETDNTYASGGKYITYTGANSYNSVNLAHEISYTFAITNPGQYTFKWFMRQPDEAEGDKSNDAYLYMDGDIGWAGTTQLTEYTKFVGRSKEVFEMNGTLDIHGASSSWLKVDFPSAGDYTINLCGRSKDLQIDKIVFYKNIDNDDAIFMASEVTETTTCMYDELLNPNEFIDLLGISLPSDTINMDVNERRKLEITYNPVTASNKRVTLTSLNTDIVEIDGSEIIGVAGGTAHVEVESEDNAYKETCIVTVKGDVSVSSLRSDALRIYPNPIRNKFTLDIPSNGLLEIISMNGSIVLSTEVYKGKNSINTNDIASGNYIIYVSNNEGLKQKQIVVINK